MTPIAAALALLLALAPTALEVWIHRRFPRLAARFAFWPWPTLRIAARPKTEEREQQGYRDGGAPTRAYWPGGPLGGPATLVKGAVRVEIDPRGTSATVTGPARIEFRGNDYGTTLRLDVVHAEGELRIRVRSLPTPLVLFTLTPIAVFLDASPGLGVILAAVVLQALVTRVFLHYTREKQAVAHTVDVATGLLAEHLDGLGTRESSGGLRARVELEEEADDVPARERRARR